MAEYQLILLATSMHVSVCLKLLVYIHHPRVTAQVNDGFLLLQLQDGQQEEVFISGLKPFTNYTIFVQAVGESGLIGPRSTNAFLKTNATALTSVELSEDHVKSTPNTVTLRLPSINFTTGPLL